MATYSNLAVVILVAVLPKVIGHQQTDHRYIKSCPRSVFLLDSVLIF